MAMGLCAVLGSRGGAGQGGKGRPLTGDLWPVLADPGPLEQVLVYLATKIRDLYPGTRVLDISGYAQPVLASQGTLGPGVILVEKPFSEPGLLDRVRTVLDTPNPS